MEEAVQAPGVFLAQGTGAEAGVGGYEISVWSKTLGRGRSPAFPGGEEVQPFESRRNGRDLVVFSRKEETAERCRELKPTDLGVDPSTCQELDKCRQAVLRCTA